MTSTRRILITNDDGITAPGLRALVEVARDFGEVTVVAPDKPQSGMGHAITIAEPLRLYSTREVFESAVAYQCSGTPVDCVKLAVDKVFDKEPPDLVLSGINHGSNASINILYSGTLSAAMEAAIEGIQSAGFSLLDYSWDADFTAAKHYVRKIIRRMIERPLPPRVFLNVNIPKGPLSALKGIRVCRQAHAKWEEDFIERVDPNGRKYYWLTGVFTNFDEGEDTDQWALEHGYVSVVPVQFDLTAHHSISLLAPWNEENTQDA